MRSIFLIALLLVACAHVQAQRACSEAQSAVCAELALCDLDVVDNGCHCPEGLIGNGCLASEQCTSSHHGCSTEGWTARVTIDVTDKSFGGSAITPDFNSKITGITNAEKRNWAGRLFGVWSNDVYVVSSIHHQLDNVVIWDPALNSGAGGTVDKLYLSINMLAPLLANPGNNPAAPFAQVFNERKGTGDGEYNEANYTANIRPYVFGGDLVFGARVYRWKAQTTSAPTAVMATGMTVDSVSFRPACKDSGCWVIDVTYTTGDTRDTFNTFYLPRMQDDNTNGLPWQEDLTFDRDWATIGSGVEADTFLPKNHPCGSNINTAYGWPYSAVDQVVVGQTVQLAGSAPSAPGRTTCCLPSFIENYRVDRDFAAYFTETHPACPNGVAQLVDRPRFAQDDNTVPLIPFPAAQPFMAGDLADINAHVEYLRPLDPFLGQHQARIVIDEVEMRRKAGMLTGTVGVEYTVDTFIGLANFRTTGVVAFDPAAMQVNIHLEKTNFFSVSTEGENAYTFLEYVNMRLVTVYKEDVNFGGETEDGDAFKNFGTDFYQTSDKDSADYVQVTFTMGDQYSPNLLGMPWNGGLIPLNSVRAGKGDFFNDDVMVHKCFDYYHDPDFWWLEDETNERRRRSARPGMDLTGEERSRRRSSSEPPTPTEQAFLENRTWGPLNSCYEQSRCMHMEWTEHSEMICGGGECEWEVCFVFSAVTDSGCKVFQECEPELVCTVTVETTSSGTLVTEPCDAANYDKYCGPWDGATVLETIEEREIPGQRSSRILSYTDYKCEDVAACPINYADNEEASFFENLYMWCDETSSPCPANTDYPLPGTQYFKQDGGTKNISIGNKMCQRGLPGQKLFFVMRDGATCQALGETYTPYPAKTYVVERYQQLQWEGAGPIAKWPGYNAYAVCEPRDDANGECPACPADAPGAQNFDGTPWDGTNPCGCLQVSSDGKDQSGFDTCTGGVDTPFGQEDYGGKPISNHMSECVWTVKLPDQCNGCDCGYNKATGQCNNCEPTNRCVPDGINGSPPPIIAGNPPFERGSNDADYQCCGKFNERLCQDCAPGAKMCVSPSQTPDNFVSFNIPLGVDWYPEPSNDLSKNVFVHMVINALSSEGCDNPNEGCDPLQVKTTLFGSIPVVEGGLNIFCDGVRAKTDLIDVANADIVVGTAESLAELSRLRILQDIASTSLSKFEGETTIDSDSIEAGFLTLILKGNSSFFNLPATTRFGLELEDLITIHIMEPDSTMFTEVNDLLDAPPSDNYDTNNVLIDDGYELNGAFRFTISRIENRASLEPTAALLAKCPFNPPRPSYDVPFPTTCVTRRDVRYRGFPNRAGALSTAMEVVPLANVATGTCVDESFAYGRRSASDWYPFCNTGCTLDQNAKFMQTVLGASDYTDGLGRDYSCVIAQKYKLNSRYVRAWWINPSYEWTPTQTGGQPIFTVSQKIFLFALVNLNEKFGLRVQTELPDGQETPRLDFSTRRLLSNTQNTGSGMSASVMEFDVTPSKMLADSFRVPVDKVATWKITFALTADQACMEPAELQKAIRGVLGGYSLDHVSNYEALLITSMTVDKDGIQCPARRSSRRLLNNPTATVEMMIVFAAGANANIDVDSFKSSPGIMTMEAVEVSPKVGTTAGDWTRATPEPEESSGSNIGLIAGCAAGGAVLLLGGGFLLWRMNKPSAEAEVASALPDLAALKSQLQSEAA